MIITRWHRSIALALALAAGAAAPALAQDPAPAAAVEPAAPAPAAPAPATPAPATPAPATPAPAGAAAPAAPPVDDPAATGRYDRRLELPSTPDYFNDASRLPMAPIIVQPAHQERSNRSMVWIGGLLVLVAVFLWNRSRRQDVERMEAAASRRRPRRNVPGAADESGVPEDVPGEGEHDVDDPRVNSTDEDAAELASAAAVSKADVDVKEDPR